MSDCVNGGPEYSEGERVENMNGDGGTVVERVGANAVYVRWDYGRTEFTNTIHITQERYFA